MHKTIASFMFASVVGLVGACSTSSSQVPGQSPTSAPEPAPAPSAGECVPSGCSGTVCVAAGKEVMTTCEYKPEYACYAKAKCEKQASGECGWTRSAEFDACIAAGGPKEP
jgi:hypothetical protein